MRWLGGFPFGVHEVVGGLSQYAGDVRSVWHLLDSESCAFEEFLGNIARKLLDKVTVARLGEEGLDLADCHPCAGRVLQRVPFNDSSKLVEGSVSRLHPDFDDQVIQARSLPVLLLLHI